jgi:hypothetical protein
LVWAGEPWVWAGAAWRVVEGIVRLGLTAFFLAAGRAVARRDGVIVSGLLWGTLMDDAAPRGLRDWASAAPHRTQPAIMSIA